jgi:hypothetical protein
VVECSEIRNRPNSGRRLAIRPALAIALILGIPVAGQYPQFPSTNNGRQVYPDSTGQSGQDSNNPDKKRIKLLNAERQKALVSDADRLLKLAKELNDEVAANDSAPLNGQQLRKLDEIGKLAKSVKEKMSYSLGGYPSVNSPLTAQPGIQ